MLLDKFTEAIAHFAGILHIAMEENRLRIEYDMFKAQSAPDPEDPEIQVLTPKINAPYVFEEFAPSISYLSPPMEIEGPYYGTQVDVFFHGFPGPWHAYFKDYPEYLPSFDWAYGDAFAPPRLTPPGSIFVIARQESILSDNDYLGIGTGERVFGATFGEIDDPASLSARLRAASPFSEKKMPGSEEEIADFVTRLPSVLDAFFAARNQPDEIVARDKTVDGTFVNGEAVEERPAIDDHRPVQEEEDQAEPEPPAGLEDNEAKSATGTVTHGGLDLQPSVDLETGGNSLINEAILTNKMLSATVFAVVGESHEINAIVQVNGWMDLDAISQSLSSWTRAAEDATGAFNIASFEREDPTAGQEAPRGTSPADFIFTRIDGDLIFMNWVAQYNFMSDKDVAMMTSTGVKTVATMGGNADYNGVSLAEFGHAYDLIIVGGGIYDANIINQMNVLLDNDLIGATTDFTTSGPGSFSTSDNLLWNEAAIHTVGSANRFDLLPEEFRKAAESFARNDNDIPDSVLANSAFLGLEGLRVLYISGNILDLQYISQTNILGDSDQVALAMDQIRPVTDAAWSITTGSNELINSASIFDLDASGKTFTGGGHYSDELLVQADLIEIDPKLLARNADAIVNEAIAFLDDDGDWPFDGSDGPFGAHKGLNVNDAHDGVHSILA